MWEDSKYLKQVKVSGDTTKSSPNLSPTNKNFANWIICGGIVVKSNKSKIPIVRPTKMKNQSQCLSRNDTLYMCSRKKLNCHTDQNGVLMAKVTQIWWKVIWKRRKASESTFWSQSCPRTLIETPGTPTVLMMMNRNLVKSYSGVIVGCRDKSVDKKRA